MDQALRDAMLVCNVQRHLEELEQRTLALEQEPWGPEESSISDSEAVSDGEMVMMNIMRLQVITCLAVRLIVQQKVKHEQLMAQGGYLQEITNVTEFTTYRPHTQIELVN